MYDPLNRLDDSQRNGVTNLDVTLDAIGNVSWKSDVGSYTYHPTKRRAVVTAGSHSYGYDANGNQVTRNGNTITYASYNLPTPIASGANSSALSYGAWRNRSQQVAVTAGVTETTIYVAGHLEKVTRGATVEYRHRIEATPGTVAIDTRRSSGTHDSYYLHRDHLGSAELITNAAGAAVVKLSFSAYGERRDTDWDGPISGSDFTTLGNTTRHGYTDHEHLDSVGLIHMNGRVYDPGIGRFQSRDPYIDGVDSSQGANGYAYVHNNPLSRWDPTGHAMDIVIGGGLEHVVVTESRLRQTPGAWSVADWHHFVARFPYRNEDRGGRGADGGNGDSGETTEEPEDEPRGNPEDLRVCTLSWSFDFGQFADQIEENRFDLGATLGTLLATEAVGTMPKTPSELRGLGVPKSELNPITSQLSRWADRLEMRPLRTFGRTATGTAVSAAATAAMVFEGFYDIGTIGKAAWDATSGMECGP